MEKTILKKYGRTKLSTEDRTMDIIVVGPHYDRSIQKLNRQSKFQSTLASVCGTTTEVQTMMD